MISDVARRACSRRMTSEGHRVARERPCRKFIPEQVVTKTFNSWAASSGDGLLSQHPLRTHLISQRCLGTPSLPVPVRAAHGRPGAASAAGPAVRMAHGSGPEAGAAGTEREAARVSCGRPTAGLPRCDVNRHLG